MAASNPKPGVLLFGRTAAGENLPVAVNPDGTLDITVSVGGSSSNAVNDGVATSTKATVRESTATPGKYGLVAVNPDGSNIGASGGGGAVTVADGADVAQGSTTDAKVTGDNSGTTEAKLRGLNYLWALVIDTVNSWVKVSIQNASIAVTGTFWQATQPVSAASLPLPTGAATETTLGTRLSESDFDTKTGSLTETAPATDTASSGLNGRLQRIAQRLTSLIALLPTALGAGGGLKVDGSGTALPISAASLPLPTSASTLAEQQSQTTVLGATTDAAVTAGNSGSISAKLRSISRDLVANVVLAAGSNLIGAVTAKGGAATNVAVADNPLNNGAQAVSSENAAVTTGRMVQLVADLVGKLIVLPYSNPENFVSGAITTAMTGTTSTSLVSAPGAGLRNYITTLIVSNAHATVGTDVIIQDGSGGTTLLTIPAAAVYGGAVITLPTPLRQPTSNTALYCANVTTGASTKVSAVGYKGA